MRIGIQLRRMAAVVAAYAIALQGMFAPLAALSSAQAGAGFALCSGMASDGSPAGGAPASADHDRCMLACCASAAAAVVRVPEVAPRLVRAAPERLAFVQAAPRVLGTRIPFARAPPVG